MSKKAKDIISELEEHIVETGNLLSTMTVEELTESEAKQQETQTIKLLQEDIYRLMKMQNELEHYLYDKLSLLSDMKGKHYYCNCLTPEFFLLSRYDTGTKHCASCGKPEELK